ncbi:MAG: SWF/SNF helicase family protein [Atopobiaceae bacterium]|jgi:SNF2 family DNA or RNA helicase|nr:SWF/SNF helicase family protein [Atopobiaceae bacterium]
MNDAQEEGRLILVFSFFLKTLSEAQNLLGEKCVSVINGGVSDSKRQAIIDGFSKAAPGSTLLCQVTAGGVGLNIQSASVVVFCEPQLKPSTENQAISRAYRMGQVHKVVVHRLLMNDSVDEWITKLIERKAADSERYADNSEMGAAFLEAVGERALGDLFKEEIERYGISEETSASSGDKQLG